MPDELKVTDNQAEGRFEATLDGHLGVLEYQLQGDRLQLDHTEVAEELGGRGVAGRLVAAAVDRAAEEGLTVIPVCSYARTWLERHPDVAGRVEVIAPPA